MSKENVLENYSDRKIKIMLATMIFCSVVYGFGMFKFIPMQDAITSHFGVNEGGIRISEFSNKLGSDHTVCADGISDQEVAE